MDRAIVDLMRDYSLFWHHAVWIAGIIIGFICISGCIRFGIAIWRRHKGIYPPATSQMEDH